MQLVESIEVLNERLKNQFGRFDDGRPIWRIVFSETQTELRKGIFSKYYGDIYLGEFEGVMEVPKYKQWIHEKFILERLTAVPEFQQDELLTKISYEPTWVFEDRHGNYLPPKWEAIITIIGSIYSNMEGSSFAKYSPSEKDLNTQEGIELRVKELEEQLFGNETEVADALHYKQGIVVPDNYKGNKNE